MLSGQSLARSGSRFLQQATRNFIPTTRGVATKSAPGPSRSSAVSSYTIAAAAAVGVSAAAYTLSPRSAAIECQPRQAWNERLKPKESKGDAFLHKDAHERHAPASAHAHDEHAEAAKETPAAIEVAVEETEEETAQGQQSAYDPETGEINWDCPCLGGMAHGPCGEQFKAAFSCFVYSEAEPKGIDCVDKFKAMQDCFREHPDVYKDEIEDDEAANAAFEKEEAEAKAQAAEKDESKSEAKEESS